jgi:plasmid stabilization system protein ParE
MAFRVSLSRSAKTDADEAFAWMKEKYSEDQAIKWFNGLVDVVDSLEEFPRRCPVAPESDDLGIELRQLIYGNRTAAYQIVFSIGQDNAMADEVVRVYRIWHGSRDRIRPRDLDEV